MKPVFLKLILTVLSIYTILLMTAVSIHLYSSNNPAHQAMITMTLGVCLAWCLIAGLIMIRIRDRAKTIFEGIKIRWPIKFVVFCTILALLEEALSTSLTNIVPSLFGVPMDEAHITASSNYLTVVLFHSVIVFIPMFGVWAWLLYRYDFKPLEAFLIFGATGLIAEGLTNPQSFMNGMWVFVYGLFVYLPVYSLPERKNLHPPRFRHYALALFLPLPSVILALPVVLFGKYILNVEIFHGAG